MNIREVINDLGDVINQLERLDTTKKQISLVYAERNNMVAFISKLFPSYLSEHPVSDPHWPLEWSTLVFIETPKGQMSFHINKDELPKFKHLEFKENKWDGHSSEEKYRRLAELTKEDVK